MGLNVEDRRRLDDLVIALLREVETAPSGTTVVLSVRVGRDGHVCTTSEVTAPRRPLVIESS